MKKYFVWRTQKEVQVKKTSTWYWTVGLLVAGGSIASFIIGNLLFGILLFIGGFTIMLAGSQPTNECVYALSDKGLHINTQLVPWFSIERFSISDEEPHILTVETKTLFGTTSIPLNGVDYRGVRTVFLNHNADEAEGLTAVTETITRAIGL